MRISFPHHVFHSKPSCFLLHLAFYFSVDFILLQTIAQPLHFLGYDIQPLFFYVRFILDLICSRNRQEVLSYTLLLLKHNHIMLTYQLYSVLQGESYLGCGTSTVSLLLPAHGTSYIKRERRRGRGEGSYLPSQCSVPFWLVMQSIRHLFSNKMQNKRKTRSYLLTVLYQYLVKFFLKLVILFNKMEGCHIMYQKMF